ncbi:hypothetical protein TRFO_40942 [Tritrichomonas foetus]|uniref:Tubby C-terminal domain-containing protein n=1 Tax=Tritrichomonas foetus TaxID=1144522 RepID=A0A1J4J6C4_9EUKA|nr:hypothetical protein TRFO_40942 [Tritrichomonas foetus]|eukprot:OHS92724.1 hypothetical protein TRFO_40942 [Tritrichomonas foetus]
MSRVFTVKFDSTDSEEESTDTSSIIEIPTPKSAANKTRSNATLISDSSNSGTSSSDSIPIITSSAKKAAPPSNQRNVGPGRRFAVPQRRAFSPIRPNIRPNQRPNINQRSNGNQQSKPLKIVIDDSSYSSDTSYSSSSNHIHHLSQKRSSNKMLNQTHHPNNNIELEYSDSFDENNISFQPKNRNVQKGCIRASNNTQSNGSFPKLESHNEQNSENQNYIPMPQSGTIKTTQSLQGSIYLAAPPPPTQIKPSILTNNDISLNSLNFSSSSHQSSPNSIQNSTQNDLNTNSFNYEQQTDYSFNPNISHSEIPRNEIDSDTSFSRQLRSFACFRCHRTASRIWGKPVFFELFCQNNQIYSAKSKGFLKDSLFIAHGNDIRSTNPVIIAKIVIKESASFFELYKEPENELLYQISFRRKNDLTPRNMTITNLKPAEGEPSTIVNLMPRYNPVKKTWQLKFKGRFVLKSSKNAILMDENQFKLMIVRKTTKEDLEIEVAREFNELFIFFISIASFMCSV